MNFERRHQSVDAPLTPTTLPVDFLRIVEETISEALTDGLKLVHQTHPTAKFVASGGVFDNEVILLVTLLQTDGNLAATTVYGSADFNPQLPKPTIEDLLAACLDSVGSIFAHYLNPEFPERVQSLIHSSLSALDEAPFDWSQLHDDDDDVLPVWIKMDKSNPQIESLTDQWLKKHDPKFGMSELEKEKAEEFLAERLEAIKNAGSGSSGSSSGPITH